ncbi:hypothetical protein DEU56DRAFT_786235 [Suillus clintonianus]|uniref:uncharacterized protein n=1 Tax=Suillus clintonianus TaxID=1904413 RepID=UPI001B866913|nr:uncharacterized protein DEU56DRAFT_786235 [Suillus clintonianus]KAG2146753.1 hypothetical protein DEU56DRAFT_786235 [Suillus clintonianus]
MDKSLKNDYIQAYLDRQKVYVHSYSSEGIELHRPSKISNGTPTRARREETKELNFGFDTPILVPRVAKPIISTDKRSVAELSAKATQRTRKPRKVLDAETSAKETKGSVRAPLSTAQRDPSKRKRKKAEVPSDSDEERQARLNERRERKRVKRDIVKPDINIAVDSSPASKKEDKMVARKKGKKHSGSAGLALLHGFSATNVGKNRLTLKPLASLGVFMKGKSSAKTKVYKAKEPSQKLFSELAFLEKTTKQHESLVDGSIILDSSSRPPSPSGKKITITNYRKDKKSARRPTSRHSAVPDLPRGSPAMSEPWDIELQSKCLSSDGFCPQPDKHITGSLVLDPRMASWHDQKLPSEGQVVHSSLIMTPVKETSHDCMPDEILSSVPASAIATVYDLNGDSSIHPSHSASQVGLKRLDHPNPSVELLTSKYFDVHDNHDTGRVSPTFDQPHPIANSSGVMDHNPRDAYSLSVSHLHDANTTRHATPLNDMISSSPLRVHGIPEEPFLPLADDLIPTYRGYSITQDGCSNEDVIPAWYAPDECTTDFFEGDSDYHDLRDQDLAFLEPPHLVNESSFYPPVQAYSSDGLHDISVDDVVVLHEAYESPRQLIEYTQEVDDYEHSDVVIDRSSLYRDSFSSPSRSQATAEAYDNTSCTLRPFLQGRAMLLGIPPYVPPLQDPEQTKVGSGLLSAEVDVARYLKDHWRPHRL